MDAPYDESFSVNCFASERIYEPAGGFYNE